VCEPVSLCCCGGGREQGSSIWQPYMVHGRCYKQNNTKRRICSKQYGALCLSRHEFSWSARIHIEFGRLDPDPDHWPMKIEKVDKFHVVKSWMSSFESWRHLLYFGRPLWRPRNKKIAIFDHKKRNLFSYKSLQFSVIKTLDPEPDPDPHWPKMLNPDPHGNQCGSQTLDKKVY
jgi:hypothetical protein